MRYLKYIFLGIVFGVMFTKSEIISWYRIYEMFRFEGFHMYGVIGSAVVVSVLLTFLAKKNKWKNKKGELMQFDIKTKSVIRYLVGGSVFGLGWGMAGACPGPMYTLIGAGFPIVIVLVIGALIRTYLYGYFRDKLPH